MRCTEETLTPIALAIAAEVQWVASLGGGAAVSATTLSITAWLSGFTRDGRVLSRNSPATPSCMKRSCQRHTQVFDLPVRRMISTVPSPSADSRTISARQTCFCGALRSRTIASRRRRSDALNVMDIPARMRLIRMPTARGESPAGFKCQMLSTSV